MTELLVKKSFHRGKTAEEIDRWIGSGKKSERMKESDRTRGTKQSTKNQIELIV